MQHISENLQCWEKAGVIPNIFLAHPLSGFSAGEVIDVNCGLLFD